MLSAAASVFLTGFRLWPQQGVFNPCLSPKSLKLSATEQALVDQAWDGIDPSLVWDCHTHLVGVGDDGSGIYLSPDKQSLLHPWRYTQFRFYLDGACVENNGHVDSSFVDRLSSLMDGMPEGVKAMLLALDWFVDEKGSEKQDNTTIYTPNSYARQIVKRYPRRFEWIASIHPYREDALIRLEEAIRGGARAIKWLPPAMGINPASARCEPFYRLMAKHDIPLLTHTGEEHAVKANGLHEMGNPLLLRKPLDLGVRVICAHSATLGVAKDLDEPDQAEVPSFHLFKRLMAERRYKGKLFGDISAVTQVNRDISIVEEMVINQDWHSRLIYGSDYPLTGVMPVYSLSDYLDKKYISVEQGDLLTKIRKHNPLMFDFLFKRMIRIDGREFLPSIFESRRNFDKTASVQAV